MRNRRGIVALLVAVGVAAASVVFAQRIWVGGPGGGFNRVPPKWATPADFDGSFVYCRGFYNSVHYEQSGSGWNTDYPGADNNFSVRLMELTTIHVKVDTDRQPNYVVVSLGDPLLFRCPMLFMEDVGTADFSADEIKNLRDFFLKGGFLWVDDYWGSFAWDNWMQQISRVLPSGEFPMFDIPESHPI